MVKAANQLLCVLVVDLNYPVNQGCIRIPESRELEELQELRRNIVKYSIQHMQEHRNHMQNELKP